MPLQATSGAASQDAFVGNGVAVVPAYIEEVFSCFLYTGTGVSQTITNNVDISGKGGLVWIKGRNQPEPSVLVDTARGAANALRTSSTAAQINDAGRVSAFTSSGFTVGTDGETNGSGTTYVSWTFRKQPKFFDVVTYTGNSTAGREIPHSLGSAPGMIIVKSTSAAGSWWVFHRSLGATQRIALEDTAAAATNSNPWFNTTPTSTVFTLSAGGAGNDSGTTYVAYLFAHNAGGFGLTGTDNVISCGTFTTDGAGAATVNLGYEPQWVMTKNSGGTGDWRMVDNMRQFNVSSSRRLYANTSDAEGSYVGLAVTSTGFVADFSANETSIYIAIRRGPMKVPTTGTSVFAPFTGDDTSTYTTNFVSDMFFDFPKASSVYKTAVLSRLTDYVSGLITSSTGASSTTIGSVAACWNSNTTISPSIFGPNTGTLAFRRAPSFFDEVCYTGTGSATTFAHNLGVVPELMIVKSRSAVQQWSVYTSGVGPTGRMPLQLGNAADYATVYWNDTAPTSSVFTVGSNATVNQSSATYVAYLFATCAGVSKVGSYTGTGTTLQINCGFTAGARFVLIKRTDSTGDWYVWDTARGIVAGNDPYLLLNSTAAEVTSTDYIDTYSAGFEISSTAPADINANGGTYIFLAIA